MKRFAILFAAMLLIGGCGRRYTLVCESDTSKAISVSIMKSHGGATPTRIYYTELTGNDTEFIWDQFVNDEGAQVEAWFELRDRPGRKTVYTLPPDHRVRLKLDRKDD